jgi:glutamine transport system permease protein
MSFISYLPLLMQGAAITIASWAVAAILSLSIGSVFGVVSCEALGLHSAQAVLRVYTFIAKSIPAYVLILVFYFGIPLATGIPLSGFLAATCALAFSSSGYVTEIVRSGINAISQGQWDASFALGYPLSTSLLRVIMPQAVGIMSPALLGECEQLLKSTSLLATIGVTELTRVGMNIISRELNPLPIYLVVAFVYVLFAAFLRLLMAVGHKYYKLE